MPWKVSGVSDVRFALCHQVRVLGRPVAAAARDFGVSRKTAHKWLTRFDPQAGAACAAAAMGDRSRRPRASPARVGENVEAAVLAIRDRFGWGPRKIHAVMRRERFDPLPALRTVANVLRRNGRVDGPAPAPTEPQRFERGAPNELWQVDHKGPIEVGVGGSRQRITPLSVIDDHSRYALAFAPTTDRTMATTFAALWDLFGEVGLPQAILCDNAFGSLGRPGLSAFDAKLIRLGIRPLHGRPYHPQTQGKVEAFHGSVVRELVNRHARLDDAEHFAADCEAWRLVYNTQRPHEGLGDDVPVSRWRPSDRRRPAALPEVAYEPGAVLRKVASPGLVRWRTARISVGHGLIGQWVRVREDDGGVTIDYADCPVRHLRPAQLTSDHVV